MPKSKRINALILDNFPIIVESLTKQLQTKDVINEIYHAVSIKKATEFINNNNIGFIALDIKQNDFDALSFIKKIRNNGFKGSILVISSYGYNTYSDSVKALGANGYISKEEPISLIDDAINNILRGYTLFKKTTVTHKEKKLSSRELTILNKLLNGKSNKQISEDLSLSTKTISTYKTRILAKYNANSLFDLLKINSSIIQKC